MVNNTRGNQEDFYRGLLEKNKSGPGVVSSESLAHKELRFSKISEIFKNDISFSVHDIGMGIADFYNYIQNNLNDLNIKYSGTEILKEFVDISKERYPDINFYHQDIAESPSDKIYDYVIFSGVFHQRRGSSIGDWEKFSQNLISNAFKMSKKGIAFNFISPFVDFYQTEVYYCNMHKLIEFINSDLSRFFEIKHNYALYEFTIFVYKEEYIKEKNPQNEFKKYFNV